MYKSYSSKESYMHAQKLLYASHILYGSKLIIHEIKIVPNGKFTRTKTAVEKNICAGIKIIQLTHFILCGVTYT